MRHTKQICITVVAIAGVFCHDSVAERPASFRAAERAIDYLKADGKKWMDKRGCVSCHQIPSMLWSLHALDEAGIEVPGEELAEWTDWSTKVVNFVKPERKKDVDVAKALEANIDTMAAMLLAVPGQREAAWRAPFVSKLCEQQADDGSWKACGQLPAQKRPSQETQQATTLWVTLALLKHRANEFDLDAALSFAGSTDTAKSTERIAVGLLVAGELQEEAAESIRRRLLGFQNSDGGWGWLTDGHSDALATGLALYALSQTGATDAPEIDRAHEFLLSTQTDAGNWKVPGTKGNAKGRPTPTANYWGTAWAVIGLVSS